MLNPSDQKTIGDLLASMNHYSFNRPLLYQAMLAGVTEMCGIKTPCSLVRIFSSGPREACAIGKTDHIYAGPLEKMLFPLWIKSVKSGENPIANAITLHCRQSDPLVSFAIASELLQTVEKHENARLGSQLFNKLIKKANFRELGYLWLHLSDDFIWVFCIRLEKGEKSFNTRQRDLLQYFTFAALGNQRSWYIPAFDTLDASCDNVKNKLTNRQFETLHHLKNHCTRKECAKLMGVSNATIDRNVENILDTFREYSQDFDGKTIAQIIRELQRR